MDEVVGGPQATPWALRRAELIGDLLLGQNVGGRQGRPTGAEID
jgi:hypothetical protein